MVTSGKNKRSYRFEKQAIWEHIHVYQEIFQSLCNAEIEVTLNTQRSGYKDPDGLIQRVMGNEEQSSVQVVASGCREKEENQYYQGLQFNITVNIKGQTVRIGDGGFVDWPQQLLQNKKERMLISAIGLDMMLLNGMK